MNSTLKTILKIFAVLFIIAGAMYLIALLVFQLLAPRLEPITLES